MSYFVKRPSLQSQAVALIEALTSGEKVTGLKLTSKQLTKHARRLAKPNDILFHGKRVEAMFAFVAASLRKCSMIREEDTSEVYSVEDVQSPDYRIVLRDGGEFLVEVKNCHELTKPLTFKPDYVERLKAYGRLAGRPVKLAIYWSRWKLWTMVPIDALGTQGKRMGITLLEAMPINEMATLGDYMVATRPPLTIRLCTDPAKPRRAGPSGRDFSFTVGKMEMYCGGTLVTTELEKKIIFHFMLFGGWPQTTPAEIRDGELLWIDFVAEPEEDNWEQQGFSIVGHASSMIATQFDFRTVSMTGKIERLKPLANPSKFGIEIPDDYQGRSVPLWRFTLQPNSKPSS